ncbi:hypothetical protein WG66_014692 [Moniliophthora roreri]|nr:hypothetical protein WG66_014692 [Moniliophthora roreri]
MGICDLLNNVFKSPFKDEGCERELRVHGGTWDRATRRIHAERKEPDLIPEHVFAIGSTHFKWRNAERNVDASSACADDLEPVDYRFLTT